MQKALTNKTLEALKPQAKRYEVHDLHCPGMSVRVSAQGQKVFSVKFRYGLDQKRMKLGVFPRITLATAREKAMDILRQVDEGIDPTKRRRTPNMKVEAVCQEFIRLHAQARNKSWREAERILEREFVGTFGQRDIREIKRFDVLEIMDAAVARGSTYQANRILSNIRKLFNWCVERGIVETSPIIGLKAPTKEESRDRVLEDDEIVRLLRACRNDVYLRNLIEGASAVVEGARVTESVWAAVAYATDAKDSGSLIRWCFDNDIPLKFWGRLDEEVPVRVEILNLFLHRRSPQFVCKLVTHHHAKVIWWRGFGVYVGSANLTYSAWNSNVEAGCFFEESEIDSQFEGDLHRLFAELDANASVLTEELRDLMIARAKALDAKKVPASDFWKHPSIKQWSGLVHTTPRKADDRRKAAFLAEWHSTLQILRDIGATVSLDANRPVWVNAVASPGAQADQFLHAHYYHRTFDGRKADYERHYAQNHANPIKARNEAIAWWQGLPSAPTNEDVAINTTAQRLQELLSENALKRMTLPQFREVAGDVHAMIEFSRRVRNSIVGLQSSGIAYTIPQKLDALTAHIWNSKAENGSSVTGVITHILYGGPDDLLPERLWEAVADPKWKLECMGISAYGELVGWAMPDKFPPRNGRTSKALRSLGYDVQVHVS